MLGIYILIDTSPHPRVAHISPSYPHPCAGDEVREGREQDAAAGQLPGHPARADVGVLGAAAGRAAHLPPDLRAAAGLRHAALAGHLLLPHTRGQGGRHQPGGDVPGGFRDRDRVTFVSIVSSR